MHATQQDIESLRSFSARIDEILSLLGDHSHLPPESIQRIRLLYTSLKRDLEAEAKRETAVSYAIHAARCHLRAATNTNPFNADWRFMLYEAQVDIRHAIASNIQAGEP
jgi:hypothetical protein